MLIKFNYTNRLFLILRDKSLAEIIGVFGEERGLFKRLTQKEAMELHPGTKFETIESYGDLDLWTNP